MATCRHEEKNGGTSPAPSELSDSKKPVSAKQNKYLQLPAAKKPEIHINLSEIELEPIQPTTALSSNSLQAADITESETDTLITISK